MNDKFLKVAKEAAIKAGQVIMDFYDKDPKITIKTDNSDLLTRADLAAEKTIVGIISQNFPGHNITAEEGTRIDKKSKYTWVVDPLDGTISFSCKMPFFAVSIGLLKDNKPIMGVIYHVVPKDLYWAEEDKGAYLNGKKISVSKTGKLKDAVVGLGIGTITRRRAKLDDYFFPLLDKVRYYYSLGGGAVSMAFVARGFLDALPNTAWIWDQAAAAVIITEAGGKVSDRYGHPVDWSKDRQEFIATNGLIHEEMLKALKK